MNEYDDKQIERLLKHSRQLVQNPTPENYKEVQDLLKNLIEMEKQFTVSVFSQIQSQMRTSNSQLGENPIAFSAVDSHGIEVTIVIELERKLEKMILHGELHANSGDNWIRYTVLLIHDGYTNDYYEGNRETDNGNFKLEINQSGTVLLKFVSAKNDTILLENLEIVAD